MYQKSLALVFLWVLYGSVGFLSYGYDDEFFNMNLVEAADGALHLAALINRSDIHPPGSYLINGFFLKITGDWSFVRLMGALMTASSLWLVWKEIARSRPAFFAFVAIGLNPTLLLWGTGLRWYAYAVTVINLMLYLLLRPCERPRLFWGFFFFLSAALVYIGYIGLIIVPVLFLMALHARRQQWRDEWATIAWMGGAAAALVLPQIIVLFQVHLPNSNAQFGGYLRSTLGLGFHFFAGQGSYPLTIAGGALILGNAILLAVSMANIRATLKAKSAQLLLFGVVGLLLARLTTKYRNLVTLSSAQGAWQSDAYSRIQTRWLRVTTLALILLGNIWGVVNVASHQNTSKGTWNMPYDEILATIRQRAEHCNATTLITSDPGIAYYGEELLATLIYLHRDAHWKSNAEAAEGCVIAVRTFRGSMSRPKAEAYSDFLRSQKARTTEVIEIGFDKNAPFKRRFQPDIPDHYAYIYVIEPG